MSIALSGSLSFWGFIWCTEMHDTMLNNHPLVLMDDEVPIHWRTQDLLLLCKVLLAFCPGNDIPQPVDGEWHLISGNLTTLNRELCHMLSTQNTKYMFAIDMYSVRGLHPFCTDAHYLPAYTLFMWCDSASFMSNCHSHVHGLCFPKWSCISLMVVL